MTTKTNEIRNAVKAGTMSLTTALRTLKTLDRQNLRRELDRIRSPYFFAK